MKKKHIKRWIAAALVVLAAGAGVFAYTKYKAAQQASGDVATKEGTSVSASEITWNGKTYRYNDHLSNFLFLGVDTREKTETKTGQADAGQADALYLLSWDRLEGDITVISIPRDTMTQIETFGPGGESLGKSRDHISLSYAYGDGGYESCELAEEAVSELFYGLPIDGYCALNMDGLPTLTDGVGGITVTVPNDSLEEVDARFAKGASVMLKGEDTELFVRYRNIDISQSALTRMERQQEYIRAFGETLKKASEEKELVTDLYTAIEPYMVTNMGKSRFIDLTESLSEGGEVKRWTIPGEGVRGKEYDEYLVDDDTLYEKTVETFYVEKE
jgi:LCP family protein required for cell wall assembly